MSAVIMAFLLGHQHVKVKRGLAMAVAGVGSLSFMWGLWATGMGSQERVIARYKREGFGVIPPAAGLATLHLFLRRENLYAQVTPGFLL